MRLAVICCIISFCAGWSLQPAPVEHYIRVPTPIYAPVKMTRYRGEMIDRIAASIPASVLRQQ